MFEMFVGECLRVWLSMVCLFTQIGTQVADSDATSHGEGLIACLARPPFKEPQSSARALKRRRQQRQASSKTEARGLLVCAENATQNLCAALTVGN